MTRKTYQTGIVGNCAFMAHIEKNTNVSWLCWPSFDSSFVFGSLLDNEKGGEFSILPAKAEYTSKQYYIENTNVLRTEITTEDGSYRVTDFAPRFSEYDRYFEFCTLFVNREDEDLTTWSKTLAASKIDDWNKSLIDPADFFFLAGNMSSELRRKYSLLPHVADDDQGKDEAKRSSQGNK